MKTNKELFTEYIKQECRGAGKKDIVCRYRLKKLAAYLDEKGLGPADVRVKQAQAYQGWLISRVSSAGRKYSKGAVCNFIKTALSFYDFLVNRDIVFNNPFKQIRRVRPEKKVPPNIPKEKDISLLLKTLEEFDRAQGDLKKLIRKYRVHVVCELLYSTGLRITEAAGLKPEHINLETKTITLKRSKKGRDHVVFLNDYAAGVMKHYLKEMRQKVLNKNCDGSLLFGAGGSRLDVIVNEELKQACLKIKIPRITCHSFRHALGFHLLRAGCDIRYIQDILGHARIENTEIYTKVEKKDLRDVLDRYHPRRLRVRT